MTTQKPNPDDSAMARLNAPSLNALAAMLGGTGDPVPGQLWRARWETAAELVLLTRVTNTEVTAVPVTPDLIAADAAAVLLPAGEQPLDFDVVAWTGLTRPLPLRVLDSLFGPVDPGALDRVTRGAGDGAPIVSLIDERSYVVSEIVATMESLAGAAWAPSADTAFDINAAMKVRGLTVSALAAQLEVEPGIVTAFARGRSAPEGAVLTRLAELFGIAESAIAAVAVDADLAAVLDMPRFRHRLAERGRLAGFDDEGAWRREVATHRLALAARTTGSVSDRNRYIALVEHFLR